MDSQPINAIAAAALTGKLYRFGKRTSTGVAVCATLGERADLIIGSTPAAAGRGVDALVERLMFIEAGGTFDEGAKLTTDANGKAVTASDGHHVNAIAAEGGTAGKIVTCTRPMGSLPAAGVDSIVAVSAPGAIPATASYVLLSVDGTDALTLAAGEEGHEIEIDCIAAVNTPLGTVTLADAFGTEPLTHVFTAAGQRAKFRMTSTGWKLVDKKRAGEQTLVVGTTLTAGLDLCARYNLSVTGTVASAIADGRGIPNGLVPGEQIDVQVTTAATSPDGEIEGAFVTLDNAAATKIDTIDGTTTHHARFIWDGAAWQTVSITGVVLA